MSDSPQIARLQQVPVRDAWAHEAQNFTPWLYANLDALGDAIGIPLECEGCEVNVGSFAADILARNGADDSLVLIENQLAGSDHNHLGQIMTYLAGLECKTIVWIATDFRDEHLSALKWLNEHTAQDFAFFAVRVKVVRIGESPFAPIFDILERPNAWERQLQAQARTVEEPEYSKYRREFWQAFIEKVPGELERSGPAQSVSNRWRELPDQGVAISLMLAKTNVGVFYRMHRGGNFEILRAKLLEHADEFARILGIPADAAGQGFFFRVPGDYTDPSQRDQIITWLSEKADLYERAFTEVFGSDGNWQEEQNG